jgi:hypothetical protein
MSGQFARGETLEEMVTCLLNEGAFYEGLEDVEAEFGGGGAPWPCVETGEGCLVDDFVWVDM